MGEAGQRDLIMSVGDALRRSVSSDPVCFHLPPSLLPAFPLGNASTFALQSSLALTPLPTLLQVGGLPLLSHCCQQQSTCSHHRRLPAGWNLEKPHFGRANVDKLSAKELKALEKTLSGHAPAEPGSVAAEVSGGGECTGALQDCFRAE